MENMIKNLYGTESFCGCSEEEIVFIKEKFGALPAVLEKFYRSVTKTEALHHGQDSWMLPEPFVALKFINLLTLKKVCCIYFYINSFYFFTYHS